MQEDAPLLLRDCFPSLSIAGMSSIVTPAGHIMRKCPAGVVRPLTSPVAKPSEALQDAVTADPGSISNEPLLEAFPGAESPDQAGASAPGGASTAPAQGGLNGGANQEQQAAGRRRSKRKACQAEIGAALQTLADVQVWLHSSGCDLAGFACHAGVTYQPRLQSVSFPVSVSAKG